MAKFQPTAYPFRIFGGYTVATMIVTILLGLTLVLAVACGSAAEPTAEPTSAPVAGETSQPTSTPQMAAPPAEVEVNPGKLNIMVGEFASERFDSSYFGGAQSGANNYLRVMGGFLVADNERKEMVPGIAEDWGLSEDGLTWTFTIREGVKFHNGSDVTQEDVLWTLQHTFGPDAEEYAQSSSSIRTSRAMDRIELSGPAEVSMITTEPVIEIDNIVSESGSTSFHIMPARDELFDEDAATAYDNDPIGAGPMRLVEHVPASVMKFERFDDFYYQPTNGFAEDKRVNFQSLDLFLVPEEATRVAALRSGEADIVPASIAAKEQIEAGGGRLVFGQEGAIVEPKILGCWTDDSFPCADKRVRQALNYALDKDVFQNQLFGGPEVFQIKGWFTITPNTIGYTSELDPWPFDPDKARQLMADAGYPDGQGFGKLIINTWPSTALPLQVESAQLAAEMYRRELGIDAEVRTGDSQGMQNQERASALNGQIFWQDGAARVDATGKVKNAYTLSDSNIRIHDTPELFRMGEEVVQTLDPDARAQASKEFYIALKEEAHQISVGYVNIPWGVGPRVETWEPYPLALYPSALHTISLK